MRTRMALAAGAGVVAAVAGLARLRALGSRRADRGVDAGDLTRPLPGDDIVGQAAMERTRVLKIDAWPEEVWPWIEQGAGGGARPRRGTGRGGGGPGQSGTAGYRMLQAGDRAPIGLRGEWRLVVKGLERNKWMLWWDGERGVTWAWGLYPAGGATTLVTRVRARKGRRVLRTLLYALLGAEDPFGIVGSLEGIKERAEAAARERRERLDAMGVLLSQAMQSA